MPNKGAGNGGVTGVSPAEWPTTAIAITAISKAPNAVITAPSHGLSLSSSGQQPLGGDFSFVQGMSEINGQFGTVLEIVDVDNFKVNIDTSNFRTYRSGGYFHHIHGPAPYNPLTNTY